MIHGSFSKHFSEIQKTRKIFEDAGIDVLAPKDELPTSNKNGFLLFEGEKNEDPRLVELKYLHNLKILGTDGFSYFVNPEGYIGKSASYELGIAQITNTRCYYSNPLSDHPAYIHKNSVISPEALADYIIDNHCLPDPKIQKSEIMIDRLWNDLMVPGSVVAAGAIIEFQPKKSTIEKEVLLVKTHKWGHRYSIVGGKVRRNESLTSALLREVKEETNLKGDVGKHLATFDQIKDSGYYRRGIQHIFIDNVVSVRKKNVVLSEEAQDYLWALPSEALASLDIEPNARHTLEIYQASI